MRSLRLSIPIAILVVACGGSYGGDDLTESTLPARQPSSGTTPPSSQEPTVTTADPAPAATCSDGTKNGSETDVDCGGSCSAACASGKACNGNADCATSLCVAKACCSRTPAGIKSTGLISGTQQVCCDGAAIITAVEDCGTGANHYANKVSPKCAQAGEGAMNGGSPCAKITCAVSTCQE